METHCIARFDTLHGPMFLFDASAVKAVLEALPITEFAGGAQLQSSVGSMLDPVSFVGSCTRLQGFTIEEWANHARKKSSLASRICKQNGELKAQVRKQRKTLSISWTRGPAPLLGTTRISPLPVLMLGLNGLLVALLMS